jgi:hypothetical protein
MEAWQIFLVIYLAVAAGMAVNVFKNKKKYSPTKTEMAPALIASIFSGLAWGIALPLLIIKLVMQVKGKAKDEQD